MAAALGPYFLAFVVLLAAITPAAARVNGNRALAQAPSAGWTVALGRTVKLNDIPCTAAVAKEGGALPSTPSGTSGPCKVCGGAAAVSAACLKHPMCTAFVMDQSTPSSCGHLKGGVSGQASSAAHTLYCNAARGAKCTGEFTFTARTGMMFTGDYRCAGSTSPLCAVPGNINAVGAACLKDQACKAFAYNRADAAGYLKNAGGVASPTGGSDLYQRVRA